MRTDNESPSASGINSGSEVAVTDSSADADVPPLLLVGSRVTNVDGITPSAAIPLRAESGAGTMVLSKDAEDAEDDPTDDTLLRGVEDTDGAACAELALLLLRERRGLEVPVVLVDSLSSRTILKDNSRCVSKYAICPPVRTMPQDSQIEKWVVTRTKSQQQQQQNQR